MWSRCLYMSTRQDRSHCTHRVEDWLSTVKLFFLGFFVCVFLWCCTDFKVKICIIHTLTCGWACCSWCNEHCNHVELLARLHRLLLTPSLTNREMLIDWWKLKCAQMMWLRLWPFISYWLERICCVCCHSKWHNYSMIKNLLTHREEYFKYSLIQMVGCRWWI